MIYIPYYTSCYIIHIIIHIISYIYNILQLYIGLNRITKTTRPFGIMFQVFLFLKTRHFGAYFSYISIQWRTLFDQRLVNRPFPDHIFYFLRVLSCYFFIVSSFSVLVCKMISPISLIYSCTFIQVIVIGSYI